MMRLQQQQSNQARQQQAIIEMQIVEAQSEIRAMDKTLASNSPSASKHKKGIKQRRTVLLKEIKNLQKRKAKLVF